MIDIDTFEREGFVMKPSLLTSTESKSLIHELEQSVAPESCRGGVRDVMDSVPALRAVASHPNVRTVVHRILGDGAHIVRSTLFDKTEASNWKVPWHQDVTVAVKVRIDTESYGPWSIKAGVHHVQPPTHVFARMLTVRIHLDPCPANNGALRVMPGTHQLGRLNQNLVDDYIDESRAVTCAAEAGEALIMRPLLLHASSASAFPGHRRILHFDFASGNLDNGLTWRMR